MKLVVFSDSHGYYDKILNVLMQNNYDMVIHLGDGEKDISVIEEHFPELPLKAVRGNCDMNSTLPETLIFNIGSLKILLTHGHIFNVKRTMKLLYEKANDLDADIIMYGHTHIAEFTRDKNIYILNPGSCGSFPSASYAELEINDSGEIDAVIIAF